MLAKINRVSFGLLTPADLATCDPHMPYSRRVMAVPFVGKDVPSRASEVSMCSLSSNCLLLSHLTVPFPPPSLSPT